MVKKNCYAPQDGGRMKATSRLILAILMTSVMVLVVTFIATWLDLGLRTDFLGKWIKAYFIAWPVAALTAFFIMPSAQRLTEQIVGLMDGRH
jgi:Protein of unknown function (DUF2798)